MAACLCLQFTKLAVCCGLLLSLVVHIVCTKENKPTNLFEAFFPCLPGPNIRTQENAQSCDLFTYAAVQLALERVNQSSINLSSTETGNSIGYGDSSIQVVEVRICVQSELCLEVIGIYTDMWCIIMGRVDVTDLDVQVGCVIHHR